MKKSCANMGITMFRCFTNHSQSLNFLKVNVEKVFSSSTLPMIWTMANQANFMNLEGWINIKLFVASWCHNLVMRFSSPSTSMVLGTWVLMISLINNAYISKISLERSSKTYEPCVPKKFNVQQCCLIKLKWVAKVDSRFGCSQHFG